MALHFRGTRAELVGRLRELVAALAGTGPDSYALAGPVLCRGAVALLSRVQAAFLIKSRGGVDACGIQWKPLKRATIANRRTTRNELRSLGAGGKRVRGLLTPAEDKRWRGIFASTLARLRARGINGNAAMGIAARTAWSILKASGAKTKLEVLGNRVVEIGRDSGALLQSLSPGYESEPSGAEGQVFDVQPGRIVVGSNVPHAGRFHAERPLWPEDGNLPEEWNRAICQAILRGLLLAIAEHIGSA